MLTIMLDQSDECAPFARRRNLLEMDASPKLCCSSETNKQKKITSLQ
jgi:hypothetical protein